MSRTPGKALTRASILALVVSSAGQALAAFPFPSAPAGQERDWARNLYLGSGACEPARSAELPSDFHCTNDWKFTDARDASDPSVANNPQEFFGVRGVGTNRAWEVSTGRPDVVIAVLDSGIRWEEKRPSLVNKYYLNRRELPIPQGGPSPSDTRFDGYDVTGDGAFNARDYASDARVVDLNANDAIDPEDLIRTFSDGVDADGNGYVDDISGWDFLEDDNSPQDDVDYGHGTGEAEDSTGEAGGGDDGQCPNCMMMPLRVGDSFIADVNHFAEAVIYGVDNGVAVIQEALGTLNHTSFGQAAVDHAYRNGVIVMASEADEAAGHHNWPAAYDHTMVVNSIRNRSLPTTEPNSYLYFNGCTNFGGYTYVSIPSTSCSSEATGRSSGISGLLVSAARNAVERGEMTSYVRDDGTQAPFALSAEEMMQLWRLSADDIDFSSPCPGPHAFCDDAPGGTTALGLPNGYGTSIPASTRYQSVRGWDYFFGYGRSNAARLLRSIGRPGKELVPGGPYAVGDSLLTAQDRIPPESDIQWPRWWRQYAVRADGTLLDPDDPADPRSVVVRGRVAANRVTAAGGTFDYVVEFAPGVQGQKWPVGARPATGSEETSDGPWTEIKRVSGRTSAVSGELARIPLSSIAAAQQLAMNPFDPATDPTSEFQPERFAVRLRVRVIARPKDPADTLHNEAVTQRQIDVYPAFESALTDDVGVAGRASAGSGSPSFHDLDGDGDDELLLATDDGLVHAYTDVATGQELPGWPVRTDPYPGVARHRVGDGETPVDNAYTRGDVPGDVRAGILLGSVGAADLEGDGTLEVLIGDLEGRLHAWEPDGSRRAGFPVSVDPGLSRESRCGPATIPACDDYQPGGGLRDARNDRDWGINSAPAIGDLDRSTPGLEIVSGSNDGHVYAWHADGTPVDGWPVILRDPAKVATMHPQTRVITYVPKANAFRGTKVLVSPSLGDLDADGDLEVVIGVNEEYGEAPNADVVGSPLTTAARKIDEAQALCREHWVGNPDDCPFELLDLGNTRMYVLHHDGAAHPPTAAQEATAHTQDHAYARGWPVPLAMLATDLLPYVGEGTDAQAVLADIDRDGKLEIAVASAAGPGYVLRWDGSSFLGTNPDVEIDPAPGARPVGRYRTLASSNFGPASQAQDTPSFIGVGQLAIGSLDGGRHLTIAGPGAGLGRLLDIVLEEDQATAEDHLLLWNARTGDFEPNAPIVVNDLQFFTQPLVADVTGDGLAEVIQGTAVSDTVAVGLGDTSVTADRWFTGGWHVGAAAVGRTSPTAPLQIATITREGYLRLIPAPVTVGPANACAAFGEWPEYGHDARNTGNYHTDAERPYPPRLLDTKLLPNGRLQVRVSTTGDDRSCGLASTYELRIGGHEVVVSFAVPLPTGPVPTEVTLTTQGAVEPGTVGAVRARDDAGNGSAIVRVTSP